MSPTYRYAHSPDCDDYRRSYLADPPNGNPPCECVCSESYRLNEEQRVRCNIETKRSRS